MASLLLESPKWDIAEWGFLDWYYSIATDNSVRESISANNVQQSLEDQFYGRVAASEDEQITQEVKESAVVSQIIECRTEVESLVAENIALK